MEALDRDHAKIEYTTSRQVQAWFLRRSRDNWKKKYLERQTDCKRLQNRVHDVCQSREKWRGEAQQLSARLRAVEAENADLHQQLAALKKDGLSKGAGPE